MAKSMVAHELWWHLHGVEPRKVYTTPSVKQVLDNKVYKVLRTNSGFNGSYNTRIITISEAFNIGVKLNQRS